MELTGVVQIVQDTEILGAKGFKKRGLIIQTKEEYPQEIAIDFVQAKVDLLDSVKVGDTVTVMINIRGNKWTNPKGEVRYFTSIQGWKINKSYTGESSNEPQVTFSQQQPARDNTDVPF